MHKDNFDDRFTQLVLLLFEEDDLSNNELLPTLKQRRVIFREFFAQGMFILSS
jgi:hypothetical protein